MKAIKTSIGSNATASQYNSLIDDAKAASFLLPHAQATPDMTVKVEAGVCYISGTRVIFAGGNSPAFTAPVSNNRIDLLCIDNTGSLSVVQGTPLAIPTVPTYPTDKLTLCEVYLRTGTTHIDDVDDTVNGYVKQDVRAFIGSDKNFGAVAENFIPDADNTRALGTSAKQWSEVRAKKIYQDNLPIAVPKFGGNGTDGALNITSGTTTIDLGGAKYFIKNYSSISITGTGALAFTNAHGSGTIISLKSLGNVTITSTASAAIDVSGLGGGRSTIGGAVKFPGIFSKAIIISTGRDGGGGSSSYFSGTPGNGGKGGGALIIECGGNYNFGSGATIKANGITGTAATTGAPGCGAGGSGGMIYIIYAGTLTANAGTYQATGGPSGNSNPGAGGTAINEGGGDAFGGAGVYGGTDYGTGGTGGYGNGGNPGGVGSGSGGQPAGGGGGGSWLVAFNTELL